MGRMTPSPVYMPPPVGIIPNSRSQVFMTNWLNPNAPIRNNVSDKFAALVAAKGIFWLKRGVGQVDAGGSKCSQWTDQTGLGHHILQATGSLQPAITAQGTIITDGVSGTGTRLRGVFSFVHPFSYCMRFKEISWVLGAVVCTGSVLDSANLTQRTASPNLALYSTFYGCDNATLPVGAWGSLVATFNGAASSLLVGGVTQSSVVDNTTNPGGFTIGADSTQATQESNCEFAEIAGFSQPLTLAEQLICTNYLDTVI